MGEQHDFLSFLGHPNPGLEGKGGGFHSTHVCVHYFDNSLDICSPGDHPAGQPELALVLPLALSLVIK